MMKKESLEKLDQSLAKQYGSYASYPHESDPSLVKTYDSSIIVRFTFSGARSYIRCRQYLA
jgi:hypothetical protein